MLEDQIQDSPRRHEISTARPNKRQRYTLVACEKCKKRKIKCSGETPCRQCANHNNANCVYDRLAPKHSTPSPGSQESACVVSGLTNSDQIAHPHALWPLSRVEAIDLLEALSEDIETLYPFLDLQEIKTLVDIVYNCSGQPRYPESNIQTARWDDLDDRRNVDFLKILLACALSMKKNMENDPSQRFISTAEENHFQRLRFLDVDVKEVAIATILSVYDYRRDNITLAWRKIGAAAKLCLELGLHRMSSPILEDPTRIRLGWETKMFWCVYVLDRRYSFMANLPFTLQDRDIDFELLQADTLPPYLIPMVMYGRLGGKIIPTAPKFGFTYDELNENTRKNLGSEIDRWMETTSNEMSSAQSFGSIHQNFNPRRLRHFNIFFEIRANQMRLSLYKHSLYTPNNVLKYPNFARRAVQVATKNIRVLSETRDSSCDIDEFLRLHCYFFLTSSLVSLHLAIRNAPRQFSNSLLEYTTGLKILKSISVASIASEKLRKSVQTLENALNSLKFGLVRLWGNSLPSQLNYSSLPISTTNFSNETSREAPKHIDPNSRKPHYITPLSSELSLMSFTPTPQSSGSFEHQNDERIFMNEEEKGKTVLEEFFMDDFGPSEFWNTSEMFCNNEAIASIEIEGLSERM